MHWQFVFFLWSKFVIITNGTFVGMMVLNKKVPYVIILEKTPNKINWINDISSRLQFSTIFSVKKIEVGFLMVSFKENS